jgi:hypothetical protein
MPLPEGLLNELFSRSATSAQHEHLHESNMTSYAAPAIVRKYDGGLARPTQ